MWIKYLRQKLRKHHEEMFSKSCTVITLNFPFPGTHHLKQLDTHLFYRWKLMRQQNRLGKQNMSTDLLHATPSYQNWSFWSLTHTCRHDLHENSLFCLSKTCKHTIDKVWEGNMHIFSGLHNQEVNIIFCNQDQVLLKPMKWCHLDPSETTDQSF